MMLTIIRKRRMAMLAAGLLLPALAGCSRSEPEEQPVTTSYNDTAADTVTNEPEETAPAMMNEVEPVAVPTTAAEAPPPPPPPPERTVDQQMMDDASATGMTARVQRTPSDAATDDAPKDGQ